ncbi:MAG: M3 family metallopeptidase [Gammaproteobacteria bacterium]|nr:M3 family metallopeptidase [Gammaproteobacteria bacterium]
MKVNVDFNFDLSQVNPNLEALLNRGRQLLIEVKSQSCPHYMNVVEPLALFHDELGRFWSPISHLNAVKNTPELREVYEAGIAQLTIYQVEMGQDRALYQIYEKIAASPELISLTAAQQKVVEHALRDFRLAGVALNDADQLTYKEIETELSELSTQFDQHVMDATDAWSAHIEDSAELSGIPGHILAHAASKAAQKGLKGYVFGIDAPTYVVLMNYAENRAVRQRFYQAYVTRASDLGEAGFDNSEIMVKIVNLKQKQASLLGFKDYAHYSLANKMAPSVEAVFTFLEDLCVKSRPYAEAEIKNLTAFAKQKGFAGQLESYDVPYYSELLKQEMFGFSEEELRPYFPISKVLNRFFELLQRVFGLRYQEVKVEAWHPDVQFFEVYDESNQLRGGIYFDLYARPQKRSGAWMDDCQGRVFKGGRQQDPIAFLTANFLSAGEGLEPCLTHDDLITLFHEMGHVLQHILTRVDEPDVAGISGVAWDAVELPSQFMENFAWQKDVLHDLPADLRDQLLKSRHFQAPLHMLRQLEFAIFDLRLHETLHLNSASDILDLLKTVRQKTAILLVPDYNRFVHSFGHIFAGGYSAGYYSYKWAEVLSCDAFSRFEEEGVYSRELGLLFRETVLALGGAVDAMDVFVKFRGRLPTVDALLRSSGMEVKS